MTKNASIGADGFRFYAWPGGDTPLHHKYGATEPMDVLSVTSIRTLAGEPFQLVNWKISNVVNLAMGVRKTVKIGPRGGINEVYTKDGPFPGEFVTRMVESRGGQEALDNLRRWLRETADEPRDIAAVRGSVVHKLIETGTSMKRVDEEAVRAHFDMQWAQEKRRVKPDVTEEDVNFVINSMRQYWDMRAAVPFVILAKEVQVWNLQAGYAGTFDALLWFLPEGTSLDEMIRWQEAAYKGQVTIETVAEIGGTLTLGDWKTSKGVYTNHICQTTAYLGSGFVGYDGEIDERLTELLLAAMEGCLVHIRPNKWEVDFFPMREDIMQAFLGSVVFARFLAAYKKPDELFTRRLSGEAPGTEPSEVADDSE